MKTTELLQPVPGCLFAVVAIACIALSLPADAQPSSVPDQSTTTMQLGKQFRQELMVEYHKQAGVRARRQYQLPELCLKYFPLNSSLVRAKEILQAAGHEGPLFPAFNRQLPPNSTDRHDLGGGFKLFGSPISNTSFLVVFRPGQPAERQTRIESTIACVLTDVSL